jgi:hypothetical protein
MIPVGKITALTQVSARADFTAFLARCAALRNLSSARSFHGLGRLATPSDFRARQSAGPTRPVLFVVGYRLGRPLPKPFRVLARRERYRLVASDPCLVTTTVLRCPLAVSVARRFLTSSSAWRWVENEPKRSSPMRMDQPSLVGSTRKIVVIACLATNERSTNRRRSASCGLGRARRHTASAIGLGPTSASPADVDCPAGASCLRTRE